jgi:phage-related protein
MKELQYFGGTEKTLTNGKTFPRKLEEEIAVELSRLQYGLTPLRKTKAMKGLGHGVIEWVKNGKPAYRVVYVVGKNAIYVLHAFSKTSDDTPKSEEDTIKLRYKMLPKDL